MKTLVAILAALAAAPLAYADDPASLFDKKCASCHGKDGEAQTKMGAKLSVRPFSDPTVQEKLTASDLTETISTGIPDKKMPAFKEKLSADELDGLVKYVLATYRKGGAPAEAKPEAKPAETKPADAKPADANAADAKPADAKPADAAEVKPAAEAKDSKAAPAKSGKKAKAKKSSKAKKSAKPADAKPAAPAPAATP